MASFEDGQQESFNDTDSEDSSDSNNYEQAQRYGGMLDNSADSSVSLGHSETESLSGLSASDTASPRPRDPKSFGRASHSSHHSMDSPSFSSANSSERVGHSPNLLAETPDPESPEHYPIDTSTPKATPKLESQLASMSMSSDESSMDEKDKLTAFYTLAAPSMSRGAANRMERLMNRYWPPGQYPAVTAHLIELFEENADAHSEVVGGDAIMSAEEVIEMAAELGEPAFTAALRLFLAAERVL